MTNEQQILEQLFQINNTLGKQGSQLDAIENQTTKTNGRVSSLEDRVTEIERKPQIHVAQANKVMGKPVIANLSREALGVATLIGTAVGGAIITLLSYLGYGGP